MASLKITKQEFGLLRDYINKHCGILLGDEKDYLIESRLSGLAMQNGCSTFTEFYNKAKNNPQLGLRDKIVDAMTTNETLWFRDGHPFRIMKDVILPEFEAMVKAGTKSKFRIWSAASSTGQEAYSTAITIMEYCKRSMVLKPEMFEILGTDISPSALFLAINGKYDSIAISRGLPEDIKQKYFNNEGKIFAVKDEVKKMTTFKKFNLQLEFSKVGRFDIVMCRYVAIYFADSFKKELFSKISKVLNPKGYFFLGASESMSGHSSDYDLLESNKGLYYRVRS